MIRMRYLRLDRRYLSNSFLSAKDMLAPDLTPTVVTTTATAESSCAPKTFENYQQNTANFKLGANLSKYGINLNKLAEEGKIEAVIGRDNEIQQTIQVLSRKRKNNPCLVGEPGVGKTAIAEGLAALIYQGKVPRSMKNKVIVSLDLASMLAGTKFRGEFEDRLKSVLKEIESSDERIILFIDELHIIVGAGGSDGAIDASNILKPSLARGNIRCMGTTTSEEYRKCIEKDAALSRRFQPVHIPEPTEAETFLILRGLRKQYEDHHGIVLHSEDVMRTAIALAGKYLPSTTRHFPDKAIDLLDEAMARLRNRVEVAFLTQSQSQQSSQQDDAYKPQLTAQQVAEVIAQTCGVPVDSLSLSDQADRNSSSDALLLESRLKESVVGQDEAIKAISRAIRLARAGLRQHERPIGVFLMLGPTGVGKTELAKALAAQLFKDRPASEHFLRLDMSEFMERFSVSRLIGAPPGYIGYEEGGALTEAVRKRPYQLILLDEFEKAHRDVANLLLQLFDDGRLTDAQGRTVDFRNTVLLLTSNLGSAQLYHNEDTTTPETSSETGEPPLQPNSEQKQMKLHQDALQIVRRHFSPEFVNRLDEVVLFQPLTPTALERVCELQLHKASNLLSAKGLKLKVSKLATKRITDRGSDAEYGARPLKRYIQKEVLAPLADHILQGLLQTGDVISVRHVSEDSEMVVDGVKELKVESDIVLDTDFKFTVQKGPKEDSKRH